MNIFRLLNDRYELECLFSGLDIPEERQEGTIYNMKWFIESGYKKNRFKPNFEKANELCKKMLKEINNAA